jgi:hypothetical protein
MAAGAAPKNWRQSKPPSKRNSQFLFRKKSKPLFRVHFHSYARQETEQIPTVHLGAATSQTQRKGIRTNAIAKIRLI